MHLGLCQRLHGSLDGGDQIIIGLGKGFGRLTALHNSVNIGVIFHIQHIILNIQDAVQRACANGCASALKHGYIVATGDNANNGKLLLGKGFLGRFVVFRILILQRDQ